VIPKTCFALTFFLLLTTSSFAGQQEEMDKAMKMYGDEARTLMNEAEDALKEGIPEVEDYFNHPGEIKKTPESFFGFGQKRVPEPVFNPSKSCSSCQAQSLESLGQASGRKETAGRPQRSSKAGSKVSASALTSPPFTKEVLVFVSLGMPESSLKQLAMEAEQSKARLVIRGLLENSFKTTLTRLQELKIPVEIDPTLFELFDVTRVPTFVRCRMTAEGAVKAGHDRLTGNIFLRDALEKFETFGELT
jgi:type-F conjugative transfer system pilin assembly protein TrbC